MAINIPDRNLIVAVTFIISFLLINYNPTLGNIYIAFMFLYFFLLITDPNKVRYKIDNKNTTWVYSILLAVFVYVAFNLVSALVLSTVSPMSIVPDKMFQSVAKLMATSTPVLAATGDNTIDLLLTFLAWGVLVSLIETVLLFGGALEFVEDAFSSFQTRYNLKDKTTWFVVVLLSALFALFHIQAKGLKDSSALLVTFLFGIVSLWLIIRFRETKTAVAFHVIANSVAVAAAAGLLT